MSITTGPDDRAVLDRDHRRRRMRWALLAAAVYTAATRLADYG